MIIRLPRKLWKACEKAIAMARQAERYLEQDGEIHPLVGAAIVDAEGNLLSFAARREDGTNHAELCALGKLSERKRRRLHTIITTLEPCCYRGSVSKINCAKTIVRTGVAQCVIGTLDPAMSVRGRGAHILEKRGVYFTMFPSELQKHVLDINRSYVRHHWELYSSGRRPEPRPGIVRDDLEYDLTFAPAELKNYLSGPEFSNQTRQAYEYARSAGYASSSSDFARYFSKKATSPGNPISQSTESDVAGSASLFELAARYLAVAPGEDANRTELERAAIFQYVGEWWYRTQSTSQGAPISAEPRVRDSARAS